MKSIYKIYLSVLINEHIFKEGVGIKNSMWKKFEVFIFVLLIFSKTVFSKVFCINNNKKDVSSKSLALIWAQIHKNKLNKLNILFRYLSVNNKDLLYNKELVFYRNKVNLRKCLLFAYYAKTRCLSNSYFYAVYIAFLIQFFENILKGEKNIFISGHFDRNSFIVGSLCFNNKIKLNIVQHGALQIFKKQMIKNFVSGNIYYEFNFSKPYFKSFLRYTSETNLIKISSDEIDIVKTLKFQKRVIAYGCQDVNYQYNYQILEFLLENFTDYLIYIIPHPREQMVKYQKKFSNTNTIISRTKPKNVDFFISRFSTLGIEYSNLGVKTIFVNLDKVKMDFIVFGEFKVCKTLTELKPVLS